MEIPSVAGSRFGNNKERKQGQTPLVPNERLSCCVVGAGSGGGRVVGCRAVAST
jgi:hypothetical protein